MINTWFKAPKRRRYTWKSPGDQTRYQIDYIMVKKDLGTFFDPYKFRMLEKRMEKEKIMNLGCWKGAFHLFYRL